MNEQIIFSPLVEDEKEAFKQKLFTTELWDTALARRNQLLKVHSTNVSKLAREFAGKFGMEALLDVAGYLHDYGKATLEWQEYFKKKLLHEDVAIVPHSIHGENMVLLKLIHTIISLNYSETLLCLITACCMIVFRLTEKHY